MALCIVKYNYNNWRKGDHVEAFGDRLQFLRDSGIVDVLKEDKVEEIVKPQSKFKAVKNK